MSQLQELNSNNQNKVKYLLDQNPKCQWAKDASIPSPHHHNTRFIYCILVNISNDVSHFMYIEKQNYYHQGFNIVIEMPI